MIDGPAFVFEAFAFGFEFGEGQIDDVGLFAFDDVDTDEVDHANAVAWPRCSWVGIKKPPVVLRARRSLAVSA